MFYCTCHALYHSEFKNNVKIRHFITVITLKMKQSSNIKRSTCVCCTIIYLKTYYITIITFKFHNGISKLQSSVKFRAKIKKLFRNNYFFGCHIWLTLLNWRHFDYFHKQVYLKHIFYPKIYIQTQSSIKVDTKIFYCTA